MKLRTALLAAVACGLSSAAGAQAVPPTWAGLYLGINAGWGWASGNDNVTYTPTPAADPFIFPQELFTIGQRSEGPLVGGQVGYNYQIGSWVLGIEGDLDGFGSQNAMHTASIPTPTVPGFTITNTSTLFFSASATPQWFASLRARAGYVWGPGLFYVTGGPAWEGIRFETNDSGAMNQQASSTRMGYAAGLGYEWMFAPRWTLRGEYLHYGFHGTVTSIDTVNPAFLLNGFGTVSHEWRDLDNVNVIRVGLNYIFQ